MTDLIRFVGAIAPDLDDVAVTGPADRGHSAVELNRQIASVILEIADDLVARRIVSGSPGNGLPGRRRGAPA